MNLNTERLDRYTPVKHLLCRKVRVELDGNIVQNCVEADDKAGYIVQVTMIQGRLVTTPSGVLVTKRSEGKVRFIDVDTGKVIDESDPRYCE